MSSDSITTKYVELLYKTFLNENIGRCMSKAMHQFEIINQKDEPYAINYFRMLSEKNIALAVHVFSFYTKCTNHSIEKIKETLVYQSYSQSLILKECDFINLHQLKHELILSQRTNTVVDENISTIRQLQIEELYKLADICFASLVLNDSELIHSVFILIGNIIKDDESCDTCIDRFIVQLNNTNEKDRGRLAVRFLSCIYNVVNPLNPEFSLKIVLHFKLISTIVGHEYISELIDLCEKLISNCEYRFMRHTIGCFSEVSFANLQIDERLLAKKILNEYPDTISIRVLYYGLRTVEDFNMRNGDVIERLDYWWEIVEDSFKAKDKENIEEYRFFKKYYYLRRIQNKPDSFLTIDENDYTCPNKPDLDLINVAEQKATAALILHCPENVEAFLKWLGDWNYYIFNENDKKFPWVAQDDNGRNYISILSKNYSAEKLIYIYMNSFLRSAVPINILLNKLYDISDKQRNDHIMVKNLFSPYRMCAKLYMYNNKLLYESASFNERGLNNDRGINIHNLSDTVLAKLKDYYLKNKNEDSFAYIHFYIAAILVNYGFKPDIYLDYNEFLDQNVTNLNKEVFSKYLALLGELASREIISKENLEEINKLPHIPMSPNQSNIIGISIIQILNSLNNNEQRAYFLKQLKRNPFVYSRTKFSNFGSLKEDALLKEFMCKVVEENGSFEHKLFIYFNTALRLNITFESFLRKSEPLTEKYFLNKMFLDLRMSCFGRIFKIINDGEEKTAIVRPATVMASTQVKYVLYTNTDIKENARINFGINYYDDNRKEFVIDWFTLIERKNTSYFDTTAKARTTLNLTEKDEKSLQEKMDPVSIKRKGFKLAIYEAEAIHFRKNDFRELKSYINLIRPGSPWRFSTEQLPCYFPNRNKCSFVDSMLIDMIREYDVGFVIDLYFNTSLRSLISLDEICGLLDHEGKLDKKTMSTISGYPLRFYLHAGHLRGYNVLFLRDLDDLLNNSSTDDLFTAFDYDKKKKRVKLKLIAANK